MTTSILAGTLSTHRRSSASTLAAYKSRPALAEQNLDLHPLDNAVAALIIGALALTT